MSRHNSSCKCGLSVGWKYSFHLLTCSIYYIILCAGLWYLKFIVKLAGMREHRICGSSDGSPYIEWRVLFYCGSSEGRSYIVWLLFLLLYDLYAAQVKQQLVRWDCFWQLISDGHWIWTLDASCLPLVIVLWQLTVLGFVWWCEDGCNQRTSLGLYAMWIYPSVMAASSALPRHFNGFISYLHFFYLFPAVKEWWLIVIQIWMAVGWVCKFHNDGCFKRLAMLQMRAN